MTELKFNQRIRAAIRGLLDEFKAPILEAVEPSPGGNHQAPSAVDGLLCMWRRLSEEERTEFLKRALRSREANHDETNSN